MNLQTIFERKPSDFKLREFEVAKTVRLSAEMFGAVLENPCQDYEFIREHTDLMCCDSSGVYHCLLLTGEGRSDGLLVESEGAAYCRYASYVPDVSALTSPALRELNDRMTGAVDYIVATGTQNTTQGNWVIDFDELALHTGFEHDFNSMDTLMEMLSEQEAVAGVVLGDSSIDVCYYTDYCPNRENQPEEKAPVREPEQALPSPTLRELLHTHWEDVHLLHTDVEIEPATIVELDQNTLTDAGKEAWADVLDAKVLRICQGIYGLQMELSGVKPSRLQGFSEMLAGYCSQGNYEKWVVEPEESPAQSPQMKL